MSCPNEHRTPTHQRTHESVRREDASGLTLPPRCVIMLIMKTCFVTRRHFIQHSGAAGLALATGVRADTRPRMLRLGAPAFIKTDDPVELARWHRDQGYGAAYCPKVPLTDTARIRATETAFREADVVIAEVGRWCNLTDPDQ